MKNLYTLIITLFVQVLAAGSMFFMHLVTARLMPINIYGSFSFGLTVGTLGALVCALGYPSLVTRVVAQHTAENIHDLVKGVCVYAGKRVLVATLATAFLLLVVAALIAGVREDLRYGVIFAVPVIILYPIGVIRSSAARGLAAIPCAIVPEEVLRPLIFVGILLGSSLLIPVDFATSIGAFLAAGIMSFGVGLWWLVWRMPFNWRRVKASFQPDIWRRASSRMLLGSVFQEVANRSDIIALGLFVSMAETAQYTAAAKIALLSIFFLRVVDVIYAPRIAVAYSSGDQHSLHRCIRSTAVITLFTSSPLILALIIVPHWFLMLFGEEFVTAAPVLRILALGRLFNAAAGSVGFALLMTGNEVLFARMVAITSVCNVIGHMLFTTTFGIIGAAWVTAASVALQNIGMTYFVYRKVLSHD